MRLLVPPTSGLAPQAVARVYLTGPDMLAWPCRVRLDHNVLVIERSGTDSVKLNVPWRVEGFGDLLLTTGTLLERDRPFLLAVELARGKVNQVRNQLAEWQWIGLVVSRQVETAMRHATAYLVDAVTSQNEPVAATERAEKAIAAATKAGELLVDCYVDQALAVRHRQTPKLPLALGCDLGTTSIDEAHAERLAATFSAATIPLTWSYIERERQRRNYEAFDQQIDWCKEHGLAVSAGPLVRCDELGMPAWLAEHKDDFDELLELCTQHVVEVVERYRGRVATWICAARVNTGHALALSEEQRLHLVIRAFEVVQQLDPQTPSLLRIDQPWAEYLRKSTVDLSPMQIADGLMRAGLPMAALGLEINMGYEQGGTFLRDRIELSRLLDFWSCLGLPLHVAITAPSQVGHDALARGQVTSDLTSFHHWSPEEQARWLERYVAVFATKPVVQTLTWNQLSDQAAHEFPHGGLIDATGQAKPAFEALAKIRSEHLV